MNTLPRSIDLSLVYLPLSGNLSDPIKNSTGVDDKTHVMIYRADKIQEELGFTRAVAFSSV